MKIFRIPITNLRDLFIGLLSILFLFYWKGDSHRNFLCFPFSTVSLQSAISLQERLPWPLQSVAAQITDLHMISGSSKGHGDDSRCSSGGWACASSRLLHSTFRVLSYPPKLSPTPTTSILLSLSMYCSVPPCFPLLHHIFFIEVALETFI